jgi:hypothetical protein
MTIEIGIVDTFAHRACKHVSESLADQAAIELALTPALSPRRGRIVVRLFATAKDKWFRCGDLAMNGLLNAGKIR